jgi:iron(II)-dependent oxidoreductase
MNMKMHRPSVAVLLTGWLLTWVFLAALPALAVKVCPTCKTKFDDGVNFCPHDGKPLKAEKAAPSGKAEITVIPVAAEISVDGIARGSGPRLVLDLPAGEHGLTVSLKGFAEQKLKFTVQPGQLHKLSLELNSLESLGAAPAAATTTTTTAVEAILPHTPAEPDREVDYSGMVEVNAGSYLLGNERGNQDERPLRRVKTPGFLIDRHEVTCAQYLPFLEAVRRDGHKYCHPLEPPHKDHTPFHTYAWALRFSWVGGKPPSGMENHPVVLVDWFDAYAFANWSGKRLPTEDEWEIAAGSGDGREFPWGNTFGPEKCAVGDAPVPVGAYPDGMSPWGAHDMAGNVSEWTATVYEADARDGKVFQGRHGQPIIRGGSWDDSFRSCRVSARDVHRSPYYRSTTVGFRCVADRGMPGKP